MSRLIDTSAFDEITIKDKSEDFIDGAKYILDLIDAQPTAYDKERDVALIENLISKLEKLKQIEFEKEDNADEDGLYNDVEEAFEDGESHGKFYAYSQAIKIVKQLAEEYKQGGEDI